jgi:flagellar biosynthesis/type III secretory pathway chaperone
VIQFGYDFILFEKALDLPQLSLCSQTRMKFLKRAGTNQKIKSTNDAQYSQNTLSNLVQHLRGSNLIRVNAQAHESTEQLVNVLHNAEASVRLKFRSLQYH